MGDEASLYDLDGTFLGSATIIVVSDSIDARTRTFDVRASAKGINLMHGELVQVEVASGASVAVYELPPSSVRWDTDGTYIYQLIDAEPGAQRPYRAKIQRIDLIDETASAALFTAALDERGLYATTGSFKLKEGVLAQLSDRTN